MRSATPVCVRIPAPTTDTLLTCSSYSGVAPSSAASGRSTARAAFSSPAGTVKPTDARPLLPTLWAIMSTTMLREATASKMRWLTPGRSGTSLMETRASSRTRAAPHTTTSRIHVGLRHDPGAVGVAERRPHLHRHVELLGELDAARVHDAGPDAGQLQHLVVADRLHLPRLGHDPRVGGVNAVHVGVNLAAHVFKGVRDRVGVREEWASLLTPDPCPLTPSNECFITAARATAVVSEPPRPSVVMLEFSSMPWKPATMTIWPSSSACACGPWRCF